LNHEKEEMDLQVEEEKRGSLSDDLMDEMEEKEDRSFLLLKKMKIHFLLINIRKILKRKMEKTEGQKINMEQMQKT
jgi:hypothetical protein